MEKKQRGAELRGARASAPWLVIVSFFAARRPHCWEVVPRFCSAILLRICASRLLVSEAGTIHEQHVQLQAATTPLSNHFLGPKSPTDLTIVFAAYGPDFALAMTVFLSAASAIPTSTPRHSASRSTSTKKFLKNRSHAERERARLSNDPCKDERDQARPTKQHINFPSHKFSPPKATIDYRFLRSSAGRSGNRTADLLAVPVPTSPPCLDASGRLPSAPSSSEGGPVG